MESIVFNHGWVDGNKRTGLGLAIARRVFEVHQGGVVAEPRDGGGLTIRVWLP